jgi:hypothetical protein
MPARLLPYRAGYAFASGGAGKAGVEELEVARAGTGWRIDSHLQTTWPEEVVVTLDWELDEALVTRVLHIHSQERFSGEHELELTVSGNGLLAHRLAPDGPTQVELGWGPTAELDYISAAFPAVMLARQAIASGVVRDIEAVQLGTADLIPVVVRQRLRGLLLERDSLPPGLDQQAAAVVECLVIDTGHVARIWTAASGALVSYSGLLNLAWLEPTK